MAASADSPIEPKDVDEAYFIIPKWSRRGKDMEKTCEARKTGSRPAAGAAAFIARRKKLSSVVFDGRNVAIETGRRFFFFPNRKI